MNSIVSCPLSCEKRLRPIGFPLSWRVSTTAGIAAGAEAAGVSAAWR